MIAYFVSPTEQQGIDECGAHGWTAIARLIYVTLEKNQLRIVTRSSDLVPFGGRTPMMRSKHYKDGGPTLTEAQREAWIKNRDEFNRFAVEGNGIWVRLK